jgi:hypothetical protein
MNSLLTDVDAWITAALFAAAMLAGWAAGWWMGRARVTVEGETTKLQDAIMALLGLLLAFTFSISLTKHDQRRQMMVIDSNAIGDFYTCASLLDEPQRAKLQSVVRKYVEHRLAVVRSNAAESSLPQHLDEIQRMHGRMQSIVEEAVDQGTPLVVPLVNTLNALTSSHAARLVSLRDRLPPSIVVLLASCAVLTMVLAGRQQGAAREWRLGLTLSFTALVSMVIWVTLDLNQPQRGWITVSQEPLERLLKGMEP